MNFYERFCEVCKRSNVSPSKAATEAGLSKSLVSKWKQNPDASPSIETVAQLANYFGMTIDKFFYGDDAGSSYEDRELDRMRDLLRQRPECRQLLYLCEISTPKQVDAYASLIVTARSLGNLSKK